MNVPSLNTINSLQQGDLGGVVQNATEVAAVAAASEAKNVINGLKDELFGGMDLTDTEAIRDMRASIQPILNALNKSIETISSTPPMDTVLQVDAIVMKLLQYSAAAQKLAQSVQSTYEDANKQITELKEERAALEKLPENERKAALERKIQEREDKLNAKKEEATEKVKQATNLLKEQLTVQVKRKVTEVKSCFIELKQSVTTLTTDIGSLPSLVTPPALGTCAPNPAFVISNLVINIQTILQLVAAIKGCLIRLLILLRDLLVADISPITELLSLMGTIANICTRVKNAANDNMKKVQSKSKFSEYQKQTEDEFGSFDIDVTDKPSNTGTGEDASLDSSDAVVDNGLTTVTSIMNQGSIDTNGWTFDGGVIIPREQMPTTQSESAPHPAWAGN